MTEGRAQTPLHAEHVRLGGRMVPFAGYEMPQQYSAGSRAEHRSVRECAGLFDVSHMGEFEVAGPGALDLVQSLSTNDASRLDIGQAQYSAFCNESGGVLDDLLVYRFADRYMLVVNASNRAKDWSWLASHAERFDAQIADRSDETALLALQGPKAAEILAELTDMDLEEIGYYRFEMAEVAGAHGVIARTGYTGEDGFELYVEVEAAAALWRALLDTGVDRGLAPAGLGARDSLRLEMGYALYGNDLDDEHTAHESGLGWIVKPDKGEFVGREVLTLQKIEGVPQRLVGLRLLERGFPRSGYDVVASGEVVGELTSGTVSPSLGVGVALGYVSSHVAAPGTRVSVHIRGKEVPAEVVRPPFYRNGSIRR